MQTLVTYHAQPGSDSEDRLRLLASASAPEPQKSWTALATPAAKAPTTDS
jgi:hypothetical protein